MNPDRRHFMATATSAIAGISLPGWIPNGPRRAQPRAHDGLPRTEAEAIALAKERGRPLLVFVMPEDSSGRWYRGELFGGYLERVRGVAAAELSLCDLWCSTIDETRRLLPGVDLDLLFAFVLEPDGSAPGFV